MSAVGELLAGRYELRSRIGRGGMAEVFRALDRRLGREVAVKVLAGHLLSDPRSVQRFQREGRTAAALNHPNVVDVYDAASEGETHYLVMELVEGPTLADIIEREGPLPEQRALDIAGRIAAALQVAHERGLVHHDVKPSNVLFDGDGSVKVTDFGIARAASSDITTIQGTPPYVAPEQARGGRADPRSDVYSLGCVLFEMLTGRAPFVGDGASSVIMQHLEQPAPRVSDFRDGVSSHVEELVKRALAKDPAQRYQSAEDFRADIARVAAGMPVSQMTIVSTRHLEPASTVALPGNAEPHVEPRQFEPPRDATRPYTQHVADEPRRRRNRWRPTLQVLTVTVLLVLLAAVAWAAWNDTRLRDQPTSEVAEEPRDEPGQAEEQAPDGDEADGDAPGSTIGETADRIRDMLERRRDEVTDRAVEELERELSEALSREAQGDERGAAERIQELRDQLRDMTDNEQIGDELSDRLRRLIDETSPFNG